VDPILHQLAPALSATKTMNILLLGGSGFVGLHIANRLTALGHRLLVPSRRRDRARHLILLPTCDVVEADIHDDSTLASLVAGQDAVINLVGILHGALADFTRVHVELPRRVVAACQKHGVRRLLHMSALGASRDAPSMYQRSKAEGEAAVRASSLEWTVLRPSVIFGAEDKFLNRFAQLAFWFPVLPIGGANAKFQPIWVEDVAQAFANSLGDPLTYKQAYELAGPRVYTLHELVSFAARAAGHPRLVIGLPDALARVQAWFMEHAPGETVLSRDNLDSMKRDNVATPGPNGQPYRPAPELGINPVPLEPEASLYLAGAQARTRFSSFRTRAHR
jgi:NADH dehydrogenase